MEENAVKRSRLRATAIVSVISGSFVSSLVTSAVIHHGIGYRVFWATLAAGLAVFFAMLFDKLPERVAQLLIVSALVYLLYSLRHLFMEQGDWVVAVQGSILGLSVMGTVFFVALHVPRYRNAR
ncbi:MAG TPA: hypothetical protein VMV50_03735 [Candidatus Paceibacterota bacterium]|nr:hypothetical protein [Candidatus Paceibacterota bacterium]